VGEDLGNCAQVWTCPFVREQFVSVTFPNLQLMGQEILDETDKFADNTRTVEVNEETR
jgi:hypothetical protein